MLRAIALFLLLPLLAACADGARELEKPLEPLGDFKLGHAIVLAPNLTKGPISREASKEEWIAAMDAALEERFRRYDGPAFHHIGVSVEGYILAPPGIPLVFNPKSAVILRVTVFEDATESKLNAEPEQITVLESISGKTLLGSGLTQTKDAQMRQLSANAALQIEKWMRRMQVEKGWFGGPNSDPPVPEAEPAVAANSVPARPAPPSATLTPQPAAPGTEDLLPPLPPNLAAPVSGPASADAT